MLIIFHGRLLVAHTLKLFRFSPLCETSPSIPVCPGIGTSLYVNNRCAIFFAGDDYHACPKWLG